MLDKADDVKKVLVESTEIFQNIGIELLQIFFGKDSEVKEPWQVVERLEAEFDHITYLGNANEDYQATLFLGINKPSIEPLFGEGIETLEALDAIAELGNNYIGMLMDQEAFTKTFGVLVASVPMFSEETVFPPRAWSVGGKLFFDGHWLYFGYAIRMVGAVIFPNLKR